MIGTIESFLASRKRKALEAEEARIIEEEMSVSDELLVGKDKSMPK